MKKTLIIAGMIAAPLSVALARGITFETKIQWNTNVIAQALKDTGFKPRSSVGFVYDSILEALLELDTFSARQAVGVCLRECNKSEMLKEGRGNSGKKCPQLCEEFASSLVIANNKASNAMLTGNVESQRVDSHVQYGWRGAGYSGEVIAIQGDVVTTFKEEEDSPDVICKKLTDDAFKRGVKYPMLCEGECGLLGQDIINVSGGNHFLRYEVGDFCDGWFDTSGKVRYRVHFDGSMGKLKN